MYQIIMSVSIRIIEYRLQLILTTNQTVKNLKQNVNTIAMVFIAVISTIIVVVALPIWGDAVTVVASESIIVTKIKICRD